MKSFLERFLGLISSSEGKNGGYYSLGMEEEKSIIRNVFKTVGYMITENFIDIFINRYSVVEMFLIYAFLEETYFYFKSKTNYFNSSYESVQKTNENFSNLESMMEVTILNINNYIHYLIMRINASYFDITNL